MTKKRWKSNSVNANELQSLKSRYQSYVLKIYSESFLNDKKQMQTIRAWRGLILEIRKSFLTFKNKGRNSSLIDEIGQVCDRSIELMDYIPLFKNNLLSRSIIKMDDFKKQLLSLPINLNNEVLVFEYELISFYFDKTLLVLNRFKLNRQSKLFFDSLSYGEIFYSIYVPIQKNTEPTNKNCVKSIDLPSFYRFKGRI